MEMGGSVVSSLASVISRLIGSNQGKAPLTTEFNMIILGSKVRDSITGLEGIATARCTYLYGCVRIGIQPTALEGQKVAEEVFLDEQRVEVLEERKPVVSPASSALSGGPQSDPRASRSLRR
jgi:hypothetical protein